MTSGKSLLLSIRNVYATLATSAPTMVDAFRGRSATAVTGERLETWASRIVANSEMMISVHGREHIAPGRSYLYMSNHQSHYDVAVLHYVLGSSLRVVVKRELLELPVFGRALRASDVVTLEDAKERLLSGTSIWVAPEGTRSPTGELLPFEKSGFTLAMEAGVPILPISLRGTREVLRAHGVRSRRGVDVFVTIHPPIHPRRFADRRPTDALDAMTEDVRRAIASGL